MADGKVVIDTSLNNDGLKKGISEIKGSLGGLKSVVGKITGTIAAAFAVQKVLQFGAACIELGSNVAEVQNVVDTAFGSMAYKMEQFADTAITQFGMSKLAAKKTGSSYMAMARGMGVAEEAASDMAIALTGLSGDVASFYNITQEEAAYKLQSVFTGETESLKELGVVMTQTNLQQYAMANGMGSNIQAMNQAQQTALRYSYVVDQLRLASGDFAKTQDSWANQTRILAMQWQEFMSIIGQALTTVLLPVVRMLNTIVSALINMANAFNAVITSIFGGAQKQVQSTSAAIESANAGISSSAGDAAQSEQALADGTSAAGDAAKSATSGIDELNVLQKDTASSSSGGSSVGTASPGGSAGGGLAETVTQETQPMTEKMQQFADKIKQLVEPLKAIRFDNLIAAFGTLKQAMEPLGQKLFAGLEWAWYNIFVPLAKWTIEDLLPVFIERLAAVLNVVNAAIKALKPLASWLWDNFLKPLAAWTGGVIVSELELERDALNSIADWINNNQGKVGSGITALGESMLSLKTSISDTIGSIGQTLMGLWDNSLFPLMSLILVDFIPSVSDAFLGVFAPIFADVGNFIMEQFALRFQFVCEIVGDLINGFLIPLVGQLQQIILDMLSGIQAAWDEYGAPILDAMGKAWESVRDIISSVYETVVKPVLEDFMVQLDWLWSEHLKPLWDNLMEFFGAFGEMVLAIWNEYLAPWIQNMVDVFGPVITTVLKYIMDSFSTSLAIAADIFNAMIEIFKGICKFITGAFTGDWGKAWEGIQDIFKGVWDGIVTLLKASVNWIIDIVNTLIRAVTSGLNFVIDKLNTLSFDIPDWVPEVGGQKFGFDIPTITAPQIPKLAQGAVLPANKPFLAMVGDQKRGTNVEAPLETIQQALAAVLAQTGSVGGVVRQPIEIKLDGQVLYRAMAEVEERQGVKIGGAFANAY